MKSQRAYHRTKERSDPLSFPYVISSNLDPIRRASTRNEILQLHIRAFLARVHIAFFRIPFFVAAANDSLGAFDSEESDQDLRLPLFAFLMDNSNSWLALAFVPFLLLLALGEMEWNESVFMMRVSDGWI